MTRCVRSMLVGFYAAAIGWPGGPSRAAGPGALAGRAVYVADSADDRVIRLVDRDGTGTVEPESTGEVTVFYDDSSPGPDLSVPAALALGPRGELYLLDGGTLDAVFVLEDKDGDGLAAGEGEWRVFYDDTSPGPNLATPKAMALGGAGDLYIADDGSGAQRILRVSDLDRDGSALGADEWAVVYDKTALAPASGPLLDIEALGMDPSGSLLAADAAVGRIVALRDLTGDGDFLDADEAVVFYDPLGAHPLTAPVGIAVGGGGFIFAADGETGLVVRLQDADGDGDALDPGEAVVVLDPASPPFLADAGALAVEADGTLLVLDRARDAAILARDLDGDGAARSEGESRSWLADGGRTFSTPDAVAVGAAPPEPRVSIASVQPATGSSAGGTRVRLSGRFPAPETAAVSFGGSPATILTRSDGEIECLTPPGREGPAEVRVATSEGAASLPAGFRYHDSFFRRGDGNGDGGLDISDAVAILSFLFLGGPAPACADIADADDDGVLSITDPIYLLQFLFQGGDSVPPPGPEPGPDPTPDELSCAPSGP